MKHLILFFLILTVFTLQAQRQMEYLFRGVVAVQAGRDSVMVCWRLLHSDADDVAFNVYRQAEKGKAIKLNSKPITEGQSIADATG